MTGAAVGSLLEAYPAVVAYRRTKGGYMKITHLRTNHIENPLGYDLSEVTLTYRVEEASGKHRTAARIRVGLSPDLQTLLYDSGERSDIRPTGFVLPLSLQPMTRYYWDITVRDDAGEQVTSEPAWFETAAAPHPSARWITPVAPKQRQLTVYTDIEIKKAVKQARAYMSGLGLYELYLNDRKQSDEYLLPGFCDYDSWIQYQTYELDLQEGQNRLAMMLGDGWYKGNFGLIQRYENYGDRLAAIGWIRILHQDGEEQWICTDESWQAMPHAVVENGIYSGEVFDMTADLTERMAVECMELDKSRLQPRLSPPIRIQERIKPIALLHTPKDEWVLDMGQNMVGWIGFHSELPPGCRIDLQVGEVLQEDCFYRDNLRSAKAAFTYISDGQTREVRQHFTFYGFRYVKIEGWPGKPDPNDFTGLVLHSTMEERGQIETSDPLVNRLISNARWGMKGNFVDVPTDCPQRDERYGWTGDAQIFSGTACYLMDTYAFYRKYGVDLYAEQKKLDGSVPDVVPVCHYPGDASTAWGDAAAIIPWTTYLHSGDPSILRRQYDSMRDWVEFIYRQDEADGGRRLWTNGHHYGDWLALDGAYPGGVYGATDVHLIASAYYHYSAQIVAKAAAVLGYQEDAERFGRLAKDIKTALQREYLTESGRLAVDTMTAYVLFLHWDLAPQRHRSALIRGLHNKLRKNRYHLETGFVGTPYLCHVLSENGMNPYAYHLLLERGYPGWLYEVLLGATTIWERWNSLDSEGRITGTEMNSLNHYVYGSIVEWMFARMAGIRPDEEAPGYAAVLLAPKPDYRIPRIKAELMTAYGQVRSSWQIKDERLEFDFTVPFDSVAKIVLPDVRLEQLSQQLTALDGLLSAEQLGSDVCLQAEAGDYHFSYLPTTPYRRTFSIDSPYHELMADERTREILQREYQTKEDHIPFEDELYTLAELMDGPFTHVPAETREKIDRMLRNAK